MAHDRRLGQLGDCIAVGIDRLTRGGQRRDARPRVPDRTTQQHHVRAILDESSDPISGKIKRAQEERIPWMLVIGKKEVADKTVTLRYRDGKQEMGLGHEQLLEKIKAEQK